MNTPRQTDHFPTVLNWLCIPLQSSWGIDGVNRIPNCPTETLAIIDLDKKQNNLVIYPNPVDNEINLRFDSEDRSVKLNIIDAKGSFILSQEIASANAVYARKIRTKNLTAGFYYGQIKGNKAALSKSFIKKLQLEN